MSCIFQVLAIRDTFQSITNQYPSKRWFQFIINHPKYSWNWNRLSQNPNLTMGIIKKYPDKPWNWSYVSENPILRFHF